MENTYAISNASEYWAEGVQDWYNLNQEAISGNGIHNEINTREELEHYDAELFDLIKRYFEKEDDKFSCHRIR